jgi:hypothetical protein
MKHRFYPEEIKTPRDRIGKIEMLIMPACDVREIAWLIKNNHPLLEGLTDRDNRFFLSQMLTYQILRNWSMIDKDEDDQEYYNDGMLRSEDIASIKKQNIRLLAIRSRLRQRITHVPRRMMR